MEIYYITSGILSTLQINSTEINRSKTELKILLELLLTDLLKLNK